MICQVAFLSVRKEHNCKCNFGRTPRGYVFPLMRSPGIIFLTGPSISGIIRTQVLIEGWYQYQNLMNINIKTRKTLTSLSSKSRVHNPFSSFLILSHPIRPYLILSNPIRSYPILSNPIWSYPILSKYLTK